MAEGKQEGDRRKFPEHLADATEEERFDYYYGKAERRMRELEKPDKKRVLKYFRSREKLMGESEIGGMIDKWRKHGEMLLDEALSDKPEEKRISHFEAQIRSLEQMIGQKIARTFSHFTYREEAHREEASEILRSLRKIRNQLAATNYEERVAHRRVLGALKGYYDRTGRIPTKRELRTEAEQHPISRVLHLINPDWDRVKTHEVKYGSAGPISKDYFSKLINPDNLDLTDLPKAPTF